MATMTMKSEFGTVRGSGLDRTSTTKAAFFYGDSVHRQRLIDDNPDSASLHAGEPVPAGSTLQVSEDASRGDIVT